jgi:hypothetical protein
MGGRDQSERLVAINRNRWSQSAGARNDLRTNLYGIAEAGYNSLDKGVTRKIDDFACNLRTPLLRHFASPFAVHRMLRLESAAPLRRIVESRPFLSAKFIERIECISDLLAFTGIIVNFR